MADLSDPAAKALRLFEDGCLPNRQAFLTKLRRQQAAYHGILERQSKANDWRHKLSPPLVNHIVESTLAAIVDGKLTYQVKPKPRFYEPGEYERAQLGATAHEILHAAQLANDRFHETQMPFAMQDAIAGITVAKTYWRRDIRVRPRLKVVPDEQALALGAFMPRLVETQSVDLCFDGPTTEVVNVEDFYWHEAATDLPSSPVIAHDIWMHFSDLKRLEQQGVYQNVDELANAQDQSSSYSGGRRVVDGTSRSKDMIRVTEIWWKEPDGIHTVTLGNLTVELSAARKNPFWHGEYPFTVCTTRPNLFSIPGKSQVEKIADLQEAHWDLTNQTQDNVELLNNVIFMYDSDISDIDALEFAPGARWPVEGNPNEMVMSWTPDTFSAELALPHMERLEQMMQNLAGGYPFTSTSEGGDSASSATQAALATNIAQQATVRLKEQLAYAYERIGQQRTELNQQFLRVPLMVEQIGLDSAAELKEISPYLLQGDYLFDVSPMVESLMRSQKRADANSMLQTFLAAAPVWIPLAQAGLATPPNFDAFVKQWLQGWDVQDVAQYFSRKPVSQAPAMPGMTPPPSGPPGQTPGITAQESIDPATSPSAQASLSPEVHLQRLGAMEGGDSNT